MADIFAQVVKDEQGARSTACLLRDDPVDKLLADLFEDFYSIGF